MSRGFIASLAGIAMTVLAWFGPWAWPGWPAFTLIDLAFGSNAAFAELPVATRAVAVTMLIVVNVGFWAALVELQRRSCKLILVHGWRKTGGRVEHAWEAIRRTVD